MKHTPEEIAEARDILLSNIEIKEGDTLFTVLRSVSRSGMQREIGLVHIVRPDWVLHPNYSASILTGFRLNKYGDGLIVRGCGMDMGFHLVYTLSMALFGRGDALNHKWI